jgi:hypothetical protein
VDNPAREAWGPFIAPPPQGNLVVGVSETRTYPGRGLDMSGHHLWNLAKKPDKAGVTQDKAERLDMSGLGARHVRVRSLEPG